MLGAKSFELERIEGAAGGAGARVALRIIAKVTAELIFFLVVGEAEIAVGTFDGVSTGPTNLEAMKAAPIEKKERLLAVSDPLFHRIDELR